MNKEKALKNQGLEFREDIYKAGGDVTWNIGELMFLPGRE